MTKKHPLPSPKFTDAERAAWDWLHLCGVRPWVVDMDKSVATPNGRYRGLVEYAAAIAAKAEIEAAIEAELEVAEGGE